MYKFDGEEYDERMRSTQIGVVEFIYTGEYRECVYGDNHLGYLALNNDVPPKNVKVKIMSLEDFIKKY